jgi:hypothetical protein
LLAAERQAFVPNGQRTVAHGGITVEEMVVPFVRVFGRGAVTPRPRMIDYNRTVKLRWLDETVDLLLGGECEAAISDTLRQRLGDQLSVGSQALRGSRETTITLLLKTWVRVPTRIEGLRDDAIRELGHVRRSERLPLHWGMTMAAYPFGGLLPTLPEGCCVYKPLPLREKSSGG